MASLTVYTPCRDTLGNMIGHMERFRLDRIGCHICTCVDGVAADCILPDCSHPHGCSKFSDSCCELECGSPPPIVTQSADLGLRLIASTLTAVLSLALLLFLVYRLRQRRHRGVVARCARVENGFNNNNNMSLMEYLHCSGYLPSASHMLSYQPPPPPYTVWKPVNEVSQSQCGCSDPPPPYSQAVVAAPLHYDIAANSRAHCCVVAPSVRALAEVLSSSVAEPNASSSARTALEPTSTTPTPVSDNTCDNTNPTRISLHEGSARNSLPANNTMGTFTFTGRPLNRELSLCTSSESSV